MELSEHVNARPEKGKNNTRQERREDEDEAGIKVIKSDDTRREQTRVSRLRATCKTGDPALLFVTSKEEGAENVLLNHTYQPATSAKCRGISKSYESSFHERQAST